MTPYTDLSIEQGIVEWVDEYGDRFRAERDPLSASRMWKVFAKRGNISVPLAHVRCARSAGPRALHSYMLSALDAQGD